MDGIMRALAQNKTHWNEDLHFAMKLARQKLSTYYPEFTSMMGILLISAHILDHFQKFGLFGKWDKGMLIHRADDTSYTTQYQEAFLKYVENESWANHRHLDVIKPGIIPSNNLFSTGMASRSGQFPSDGYNFSCNHEEY